MNNVETKIKEIEKSCGTILTVGELKRILNENDKFLSDDTKIIIGNSETGSFNYASRWHGMSKNEDKPSDIFELIIGEKYEIPKNKE